MTEADMARGLWRDPWAESEMIKFYGERWIAEHDLSVRTRELYSGPFLGEMQLLRLTPSAVRSW